jgi:hypothetical protein
MARWNDASAVRFTVTVMVLPGAMSSEMLPSSSEKLRVTAPSFVIVIVV